MAVAAKHMIKQQLLDITLFNEEDQEAVTAKLAKVYRESIEEIMDEVCSGLIREDQIVRIDSLELDLGLLTDRQLAQDFPRAVKRAITEALAREVSKIPKDPDPRIKTPFQNNQAALFYYLSTGLIPWYYNGRLADLRTEFKNERISSILDYEALFKRYASLRRAVHFFEEKRLEELVVDKAPEAAKEILRQLKGLSEVLKKLKALNDAAVSGVAGTQLRRLEPLEPAYEKVWCKLLRATIARNEKIGHLRALIYPEVELYAMRTQLESEVYRESEILTREDLQLIRELTVGAAVDSGVETRTDSPVEVIASDPIISNEEGLVIDNAGLILVWPYLEAFFTGLKLMKNKTFANEKAVIRAVHLLHYLGYGSEAGDETQWLLNKLLCGLEEGVFIPLQNALTESEMQEGDRLLTALVKNWPALKKTSAESLRHTFLQRNGLLRKNDKAWTLNVERKAVDVLLDRLTWPISVIKLPWCDYTIHTIW